MTRATLLRFLLAMPLLVAPLAWAVPARANPSVAAATQFIKQAGAQLAAELNAPGSVAEKRPALVAFMNKVVDVDEVGQFCLGRYWQVATPAQRQEYLKLFRVALTNAVVTRLGSYQGGVGLTVGRADPLADGVHVATRITRPGSAPYDVTWVVGGTDAAPKIVDVIAEGVSLRQTQRSDYASYLQRHGGKVQALIAALQRLVQRGG